ncbi:unnamed protein product [Mytilus coruscus]|uniref:C2H2-type domain-containing protein n=1 Tax=Mytilus coruscus TaxID=42192 RepID=A0A6J8D2Y8_MYTCO|nr:unnamed protein product [Mytilus coruscus]
MPKTKVTPRRGNIPISMEVDASERMLCPFCPSTFRTKEQRNKHIIECTDSRLFCDLCSYNTTKRVYLNKHIKNIHCSAESGKEGTEIENNDTADNNNNNVTQSSEEKRIDQKDPEKVDNNSESSSSEEDNGKEEVDNSKSLFEDISSDEDIVEISANKVRDPETPETANMADKPTTSTVEIGRIIRKVTRPTSVHTPRGKVQDLRQKLAKTLAPQLVNAPKIHTIRGMETVGAKEQSAKEPRLVTKYIKIITDYEENGKKIRIIEKKVPADSI